MVGSLLGWRVLQCSGSLLGGHTPFFSGNGSDFLVGFIAASYIQGTLMIIRCKYELMHIAIGERQAVWPASLSIWGFPTLANVALSEIWKPRLPTVWLSCDVPRFKRHPGSGLAY